MGKPLIPLRVEGTSVSHLHFSMNWFLILSWAWEREASPLPLVSPPDLVEGCLWG